MTKEDARELILEWANDELEFDVENGFIYYTKKQKEDFIQILVENDWSTENIETIKKEMENFYYYKDELIEPYETIDEGHGGIDFEDHPEDNYIIEVEYECFNPYSNGSSFFIINSKSNRGSSGTFQSLF